MGFYLSYSNTMLEMFPSVSDVALLTKALFISRKCYELKRADGKWQATIVRQNNVLTLP